MKKVVLESPYAGDVEKNLEYARLCVKDSLDRGESPIASHLLYTQKGILDDNNESERKQGIDTGLEWLKVADGHVVYIDLGISKGMEYAINKALYLGLKVEFRKIL